MGFGKPVLGILNGEGAKIIEEADCGVVCPPNNPEKLANTVLSLYNLATTELKEKGVNGLNYYHSNFGKARNLELLLELFENHQIK